MELSPREVDTDYIHDPAPNPAWLVTHRHAKHRLNRQRALVIFRVDLHIAVNLKFLKIFNKVSVCLCLTWQDLDLKRDKVDNCLINIKIVGNMLLGVEFD